MTLRLLAMAFVVSSFLVRTASAAPPAYANSDTGTAATSAVSSAPWSARPYEYSIGYEGTSNGTMIGANAITLGRWINPHYGYEILVGFSKSSDSVSESQSTSTNPLTGAVSQSTSYSGGKNPYIFSLGVLPKMKVFHNSWFMAYGGFLLAFTYTMPTSYQAGTVTASTPNPLFPQNQSVTETNYGTISTSGALSTVIGPRIGSEFYIPSLPNIAIGFAAGLIATITGDFTTTTNELGETYSIVNGVAQAPTSVTAINNVARSRPGVSGSTVAIAGQAFNLFGSFTIRYVW